MSFTRALREIAPGVVRRLREKGIDERHISFGAPDGANKKPRVPNDARSEFLAHRAMGDWAESTLIQALEDADATIRVSHYGDTVSMAAGEDGFAEFYLSRVEDIRRLGKRPDLLVFGAPEFRTRDLSVTATQELMPHVRMARAAIEVRSSKFKALKYMSVRQQDREAGLRGGQEAPSFTVKVEDLRIVYRWHEHHDLPQIYCQVFFDSIFGLSFKTIFQIIASGAFKITTPARSQEKATIMIPITEGTQIGVFEAPPSFTSEIRETRLGRVDAFVRPIGGRVIVDREAFWSCVDG